MTRGGPHLAVQAGDESRGDAGLDQGSRITLQNDATCGRERRRTVARPGHVREGPQDGVPCHTAPDETVALYRMQKNEHEYVFMLVTAPPEPSRTVNNGH